MKLPHLASHILADFYSMTIISSELSEPLLETVSLVEPYRAPSFLGSTSRRLGSQKQLPN